VAEALLPPGGGLPGAEGGDGGVAVAGPVSALVEGMSGRTRTLVRTGLRACEWSTFPRRFSRLPRERRAERLVRMAAGGPLRRDLALLLKTLSCIAYARDPGVQRTLGVTARCERANGAAPEPPAAPLLRREALVPPDGAERCDVVVVGSGAGGAAAARALAERGLDVVVVEEGAYHDARDYDTDPLAALPMLYRDGGLTFAEGRPTIPVPVGRCVGGTTVINSGTCFRTPDAVLARWRDEFGIAWATELEAEFEAVERDLRVAPVDPATAGRNAAVCREGAEALGVSHGPILRNAGDVVCCGSCPTGCRIDAKQATHVAELPRAVAAGARVRAGARVTRVLTEGERAAGVRCRVDGRDEPYEVRARAVVLAAGAFGTPRLLLRQGIARRSGAIGRHLRIHPACWVGARFAEPVRGWDGVMQSWYVDEWQDRGLFLEATFTPLPFAAHWLPGVGEELKAEIERFENLAVIGVHLSERCEGRVQASGRVTYRLGEDDARALVYGIARAADLFFAAGALEVYPQLHGVTRLAPGGQAALDDGRFRPRDLRLEAFHPLGTARMGADPSAAAVAPTGETYALPGLWVADASLMPTSLKVNPMVTVMACARRVAGELAARLA
jgi:choline dehydrogenase-like flavoprotein